MRGKIGQHRTELSRRDFGRSYQTDRFWDYLRSQGKISMLSLAFAFLTFVTFSGNISENVLEKRVIFASDLQGVTVSEVVRKMREYRIPISFIQSEQSKDSGERLSLRVNDRTLKMFLLDIVSQAKGYKFGIIENHLVLYPSERKYESVLDLSSIGTRDRLGALSEFLSALKKQCQGFHDLGRPVLNNPEYSRTLYAEPISMSQRTTVLKGFVGLLGENPNAILTIENSRVRLDLIKPSK